MSVKLIITIEKNWMKVEYVQEQTLSEVMSPLRRDKYEKEKSLKRMSDKFQNFWTDIFE